MSDDVHYMLPTGKRRTPLTFGNQLHQLATTLGLAITHGLDPQLPHWEYEPFFSVPSEFFAKVGVGIEASEVSQLPKEKRWYLQDISLWWDSHKQIKAWFQPSDRAREVIGPWDPHDVVAMHVRRGDTVAQHPHLYIAAWLTDYYDQALKVVKGQPMIFTDDPKYCIERWGGQGIGVVSSGTRPREWSERQGTPVIDWTDLFRMAACSELITANSSYSWWAAFLSGDPAPIYPLRWFGEEIAAQGWNTTDFIPGHWRGIRGL
jgi:Glycosyl transferase family 11